MDLDARLTITQLVRYFDGEPSYRAIDAWIRRSLLAPAGRDDRGRLLIRLGDALEAERRTHVERRGRPRTRRVVVNNV